MMGQNIREKRVKGGVLFDGPLSEVWKKTSHQTFWQIFERTFTERFTSDTFTRISCATLKLIRSLSTTLTTAHLGLTSFFCSGEMAE